MTIRARAATIAASRAAGYAAAVAAPAALVYASTWLGLPAFAFEHLALLLVLAVALSWGLGPAVVAAIASVAADNVLLREPVGRPTITGLRDVVDLALFATVAIVVSGLVTRTQGARAVAEAAAARERRARQDRDRLIAAVTHDLATPLSVLSATVYMAKLRGAAELDWSRLIDRLETASARATSLVRMLSDAEWLDSGTLVLDLSPHDLRTVVAPIARMMDRFSERHPVMLSLPDDPVMARVDAPRLQRVIENLVGNAIKYSPDGGPVELSVVREGDEAVIHVRDHGIGISAEALPHIFERSFRAPEAAARAPGLGLGLSIAAQVVAIHHGRIAAAAADGGGTVVAVRLPLAPPAPPEAVTAGADRAESSASGGRGASRPGH
jgi:signal transduction histidine kinase